MSTFSRGPKAAVSRNRLCQKPTRSAPRVVARLLFSLLALCLAFEIFQLFTFAHASPTTHVAHRRNVADSLDLPYERRTVGDPIGSTIDTVVNKVKIILHPVSNKTEVVNVVAQVAYDETDHKISLPQLKRCTLRNAAVYVPRKIK